MKTLLILRHAKSSWSDGGLSDHDRPLNKRGKRDAPRIGSLLREENLAPDLIITSSARRALTTAEAVSDACGFGDQMIVTRDLYHADPETYLMAARQYGEDHDAILVVGHNPGIEELVVELTGEWHRMPTAALAEVHLDIDRWQDLTGDEEGELANLWLAREINR